ncbi:alpha-L-rhamnosidase [Mangrovibacterium diazotrophicum]|uniref:alpha-L-rhamnosidase n=1 Tax=Mangrovibacterium diazotrophicum TaxID=1261403 RepID=A0A419W317_9BACT|nr:alpha-L-rhamnosidase [Mangrovibacterium diazotrophicum]RKD89886.1 alpha-L-rhamnosidase [Mangrovibacterium diazotrophicum]
MNDKQTLTLLLILFLSATTFGQVSVGGLTCELLKDPAGIEILQPRLGWKIESDQRDIHQTAFQILVASTAEKLAADDADCWNSGKIDSDQSQLISYSGKELQSADNCFWKVKVWTNKGESEWSEPAQWSMGLLYFKDWRARWIGFDKAFPWDDDSFHARLSARYFRKEFNLKKAIQEAKAYIIGLGLYELSLNGEKVGESVLAPSPTDYHENIKYNIYDLTDELKKGENALGVVVGNGRYYATRQHYKGYKIKNFGFPKLLFQLVVKYTDGTTEYVISNNSWKGTADGPIRSNNEYDGEEYDARKEMPGWDTVGFDDSNWLEPEYVEQPDGKYEAQLNTNMKVLKEIKPVSVREQSPGKYILDLGQNFAGWLHLNVNGNAGDTITMRFGEILQDDGELFTTNLRDAQATAQYIVRGAGVESWEPKFVYYGFRYVEITGWPGKPTVDDFIGKVVSDDMAVHGTFSTSNAMINQIYHNAYWGILSNYKGMPVDCPQRNERQPWLGDRTVGCYGENFIFDNAALYRKWVDDIAYSQKPDGTVSDVAPAYWRYYSDNMSWCGTFLMVADMLYQHTGDTEPIIKHYAGMKKWLSYMEARYLEDGIMTKDSYGDWCEPPATIEEGRGKSADQKYPSALISTAYYYHYLELMQRFAKLSGNEQDIAGYQEQAGKVKDAFQITFYKAEQKGYGDNKLTENILAVAMGLVPDLKKEEVVGTIVKTIEETNNGHLSTGVIGTQWIMRTLTENGHADWAWKLATNTTYPSWGYMVENGATTIWELWNGNTAAPKMNSYNHVMMLGDLLIWFYEDLAGIKSSDQAVGYKQIEMKPQLIEGLDSVNASYKSPYGTIASSWTKTKKKFEWSISVPANTSALVSIPASSLNDIKESGKAIAGNAAFNVVKTEDGRVVLEVGSGSYHWTSKL